LIVKAVGGRGKRVLNFTGRPRSYPLANRVALLCAGGESELVLSSKPLGITGNWVRGEPAKY